MQNRSPFLIAIDGRCAAGKTTFAEKLSSIMECSVIHMDHFFLKTGAKDKRASCTSRRECRSGTVYGRGAEAIEGRQSVHLSEL